VTLRFTPEALRQFAAAVRFLRGRSRPAAEQFRRKSDRTLKRLESFPESGRRLEDDPESPYREIVVAPYRCFY
jgi:toxin ParE1/3/4